MKLRLGCVMVALLAATTVLTGCSGNNDIEPVRVETLSYCEQLNGVSPDLQKAVANAAAGQASDGDIKALKKGIKQLNNAAKASDASAKIKKGLNRSTAYLRRLTQNKPLTRREAVGTSKAFRGLDGMVKQCGES